MNIKFIEKINNNIKNEKNGNIENNNIKKENKSLNEINNKLNENIKELKEKNDIILKERNELLFNINNINNKYIIDKEKLY